MKRPFIQIILTLTIVLLQTPSFAAETVWLSSLDLSKIRQGWGKAQVDKSVTEKPLSLAGKKFERGVGTHAYSRCWVELDGNADQFIATVGIDDSAAGKGSVSFKVIADGKKLWESQVLKRDDPPQTVDVNVKGIKLLLLVVDSTPDGITYDNADWADARFIVSGTAPKIIAAPAPPPEETVILTPKQGPAPRINGPKVYGARPGNPFLYRIPTTGQRPIKFTAKGLPAGLKLDSETGIITGTTPQRGEYVVSFRAKNKHGSATRSLKIVAGDTLSLTPQMGWNDWYAHYNRITDQMMREAADIMATNGMADVGYQYVNIDDCWMTAERGNWADASRIGALRDETGNILPNKNFPDMKAMTDYIHGKGLKAGIYTSPGPKTCAGYCGAYQHEAQDAKQFADWGFDFLKYDWCSYGGVAPKQPTLDDFKKPYKLMGDLLKQQKRDIVLNLCQYGMGNVWEWGAEVGGHSWRTAGDLGMELDRMIAVAVKNCEHRGFQKPGAWNDPDYIQIGYIGNAYGGGMPAPCPFTPTEQYAFMSLWCLMASPLFYSGDMTRLDDFTLGILCNTEAIEVDQDPLGQCARPVVVGEEQWVLVKDMEDGSKAVGLCNGSEFKGDITAKWRDLGLKGKQLVRDLWRQKDLGIFEEEFKSTVPRHGVVFVRIWSAKQPSALR